MQGRHESIFHRVMNRSSNRSNFRRAPTVDQKSLPEVNSLLTLVCAIVTYRLGVRCCMGSQSKSYIYIYNTYIQPSLNIYCTMGGSEQNLTCKTWTIWNHNFHQQTAQRRTKRPHRSFRRCKRSCPTRPNLSQMGMGAIKGCIPTKACPENPEES